MCTSPPEDLEQRPAMHDQDTLQALDDVLDDVLAGKALHLNLSLFNHTCHCQTMPCNQ